MREEALYESNLVGEEKPETNAEHAGRGPEMAMEEIEARAVGDRHRNCRCHQRHSRDRPEAEDKEVSQGPHRPPDNRQDQERHDGGTGQAVHDADNDWPYRSIPFHSTENAIQARGGHSIVGVAMLFRAMSVRVVVNVIAMKMHMLVMVIGGSAPPQ